MSVKNLPHRITIQRLVPVQDDTTGVVTDTWTVFAVVWAHVRPLSAREFIAAGERQSKLAAMIEIRYLAGVLPSMRALHGAHVYNIEAGLADGDSGIEWLVLPVSEVISG